MPNKGIEVDSDFNPQFQLNKQTLRAFKYMVDFKRKGRKRGTNHEMDLEAGGESAGE